MPVRTRSQRLKEVHSSKEVEREQKSEETTPSMYKTNVAEFRQRLQNMLDDESTNAFDSRRTEVMSTPRRSESRVDRITMQTPFNKQQQQMEFLIPRKQPDTPMEIREKLRAVLSPDTEKPSYPPIYNETTKLWTPNLPTYNQEESENISRWLIIFIFTILTAVLFSYYHQELSVFVRTQFSPLGQSLKQGMESVAAQGSNMWSSLLTQFQENLTYDRKIERTMIDDTVTK